MAMLTRYLLLGVVLALVLVGVLSACTAQGGISILPTASEGEPSETGGAPLMILVAAVVSALVVIAAASLGR